MRFEGIVGNYTNTVQGIVRMRNRYKDIKRKIALGEDIEVNDWTIVSLDHLVGD